MVGRRHVGVGPDHERGAAVDHVGEGHLLAGRLGMEIEHQRGHVAAELDPAEDALGGGEGVVERIHEEPPHQVRNQHGLAVLRRVDAVAAPGRAFGEILRPQEPPVIADEPHRLLLVPDMVAGGDDVGAGLVDLGADLLRDAEAAGGVLAVDDDEIEREIAPQPRQRRDRRCAAGAADEIAEKQDTQAP